eukprot:6282214-Pyramimonas_sp.AAC.1
MAIVPSVALLGPAPLPGNVGALTSADKAEILRKHQCSANVRARRDGARCLTVVGAPQELQAAWALANEMIVQNGLPFGRNRRRRHGDAHPIMIPYFQPMWYGWPHVPVVDPNAFAMMRWYEAEWYRFA